MVVIVDRILLFAQFDVFGLGLTLEALGYANAVGAGKLHCRNGYDRPQRSELLIALKFARNSDDVFRSPCRAAQLVAASTSFSLASSLAIIVGATKLRIT